MPCLLGIDSGLTLTKAVIFDSDATVLAVARCRIAQQIPAPHHVERDMDGLWTATAQAIKQALSTCGRAARDIVAIAATAHGDGIYLLDADKKPLGPAIVSLDTRAAAIADAWNASEVGTQALALTGQQPHASAPSALLRWIRDQQPERYARIAHFFAAKDWLRFCLTGTIGTDRTEASTSFTNVATQDYAEDALRLFGLERLIGGLPAMAASTAVVGGLTKDAARLTGLLPGTPVVAGLHDVTASALGIGAYKEGVLAIITGTYSINETLTHAPKVDSRWFCRNGIAPGQWNAMAISPASSANYDWFIDQVCVGDARQGQARDERIHSVLGREFEAACARPSSVFFHPYLFGSPFGGAASAGFYGLNAWHKRGDLLRAVIEGIAFNHRVHVDSLRDSFAPSSARLTGGISRNPAIVGLFADILGIPVTATRTEEAAAWGAALCAGTAVGLYACPSDDPRPLAALETTYQPEPERQRAYDEKYQIFLDLAQTMKPFWPRLRQLGEGTPPMAQPT